MVYDIAQHPNPIMINIQGFSILDSCVEIMKVVRILI